MSSIGVKAADYDFKAENSDGVTIYYKVSGDEATVVAGDEKYSGNINIPSQINGKLVVRIGSNAFKHCKELEAVSIPSTVTVIERGAFWNCENLKDFSIPSSIETISAGAFKNCKKIVYVRIPASTSKIEYSAFEGCNIATIEVANGNPHYDSREHCNAIIETATNTLIVGCYSTKIPSSVVNIGTSAFKACKALTKIDLPSSVKSIGKWAFADCTSLEEIHIPEGVTRIENLSFAHCTNLSKVYISNSVEEIVALAFAYCSGLEEVKIPKDSRLMKIGGGSFDGCALLKNVILPQSLHTIGIGAFEGCKSMEEIIIPQNVDSIETKAFAGCSSLKKVTSLIRNPFKIEDNTFPVGVEPYFAPTLYIPIELQPQYKRTPGWNLFFRH